MNRSIVALVALLPSLAFAALPLPGDTAATLKKEIAAARASTPRAFAAVDSLWTQLPSLEAQKRGGLLPVGPMLKPLGPDALWPLVEELAFLDRAAANADLAPAARVAWQVGVLEALGVLRDGRARPVLEAALARTGEDLRVTRAAAEALGRLGDDAAVAVLVARSRTGEQADAVLSGMGNCRRLPVAQRLAQALGRAESAEQAFLLARALADVGNAWAWQTPAVRQYAQEEAEVRRVAAGALLAAFVRFDGEVRQETSNALLVVDAPQTAELVAAARARAGGETAAALDGLSERLAQSPVR